MNTSYMDRRSRPGTPYIVRIRDAGGSTSYGTRADSDRAAVASVLRHEARNRRRTRRLMPEVDTSLSLEVSRRESGGCFPVYSRSFR